MEEVEEKVQGARCETCAKARGMMPRSSGGSLTPSIVKVLPG